MRSTSASLGLLAGLTLILLPHRAPAMTGLQAPTCVESMGVSCDSYLEPAVGQPTDAPILLPVGIQHPASPCFFTWPSQLREEQWAEHMPVEVVDGAGASAKGHVQMWANGSAGWWWVPEQPLQPLSDYRVSVVVDNAAAASLLDMPPCGQDHISVEVEVQTGDGPMPELAIEQWDLELRRATVVWPHLCPWQTHYCYPSDDTCTGHAPIPVEGFEVVSTWKHDWAAAPAVSRAIGHRVLLPFEIKWTDGYWMGQGGGGLKTYRGAEGTSVVPFAAYLLEGADTVCVTLEMTSLFDPEPLLEERCLSIADAAPAAEPAPYFHPDEACEPIPREPAEESGDAQTRSWTPDCAAAGRAVPLWPVLLLLTGLWWRRRVGT